MALGAINHPFGIFNAAILLGFLLMPCRHPKFGRGRPYFWARQACLVIASMITAVMALALWFPRAV